MIRIFGPALFVVYASLIAYVSLAPNPEAAPMPNDKLAHLMAYVVFALVAIGLNLSRRGYLYACLFIVAYGGLLEVGQSFVPGRHMSLPDLLANTVGVGLGAVLVLLLRRYDVVNQLLSKT